MANAVARLNVDGAEVGSFTYDSTNKWYIYNLNTRRLAARSHTLTTVLTDGTTHPITITLT